MEKRTAIFAMAILVLSQLGCASQPREVTQTVDENQHVFRGKITNIKQVEVGTSIPQDILGSGLGMLVAGSLVEGSSETAAEVAGLFIGSEVTNEVTKRTLDEITIIDETGNTHKCLVKQNTYRLNELISFNVSNDKKNVVAISRL